VSGPPIPPPQDKDVDGKGAGRHDDITYASIAKAFDLPLVLHEEAFSRMKKLSRPHPSQPNFDWNTPSAALTAKKRMVELPFDNSKPWDGQALFVSDDLWVPLAVVNGNIHILPGVPRLFEKMLDCYKVQLLPRLADPEGKGVYRILISTPLPESEVAAALATLARDVERKGIKVGSYPRYVSIRMVLIADLGFFVRQGLHVFSSLMADLEKAFESASAPHQPRGKRHRFLFFSPVLNSV
jgi:molybdopterin-biosynthesis enzyme MoeA-like protein